MSDKCSHNNHTHFLLWFFVLGLCFSSCLDCSGQEARTKNAIISLNNSVYQLQNEANALREEDHSLNTQNLLLAKQLEELRVLVYAQQKQLDIKKADHK